MNFRVDDIFGSIVASSGLVIYLIAH